MARLAGVSLDADIATCLYTALMTDTGSFMFEGTNEHTFAIARELVLRAPTPLIVRATFTLASSTAKLRLLGAALANLHREGSLAWIWVTQEQMERFDAIEEDCERPGELRAIESATCRLRSSSASCRTAVGA